MPSNPKTPQNNMGEMRRRAGFTQKQAAEAADIPLGTLRRWEQGQNDPDMGSLMKLADLYRTTLDSMLVSDRALPPNALPARPSEPAYAPLLGRVHAGDAQEPDVLDERIPLPKEVADAHPAAYFLQVEGQCMSRVYPEGCFILIDPDREPLNGSIAVVSIDGSDYVMRRLYRGASTLVLSPESWDEGFEDIVISSGDERTVEFHGTVVWFQAREEME